MAASKAKGKLVSIVINNEYIKICEITKSGKNSVVHKTVTIPAPEDCYVEGVIEQTDVLAKAIKVVMDEHRFNANNVAFLSVLQDLQLRKFLFLMLRLIRLINLYRLMLQSISQLIWMSISFSIRFLRK